MLEAAGIREWRGRGIAGAQGGKAGEPEAVYVDTATDLPSSAAVTVGLSTWHRLVFVPWTARDRGTGGTPGAPAFGQRTA